ncbi:MAG: hypothetical protein ACI9WU_000684 [Myxococcota bacterium]|jgi:hypothetical protein
MGCAHLFLGSLFVLGEGNGGTEGGRVESRLAVSAVLAHFRGSQETDHSRRLVEALRHASQVLHDRAQSAPAFQNSYANCLAVLMRRGQLMAARVGDLRLELVRDGKLQQIFPVGTLQGPRLGENREPEVEVLADDLLLQTGDRVLLSNPALHTVVSPEELTRLTSTLMPPVAARRLIESSERAGSREPASVQIVQVGESLPVMDDVPPAPMPARDPMKRDTGPDLSLRRGSPSPRRPSPLLNAPEARSGLDWRWIVALMVLGIGIFTVQRLSQSPTPESYAEASAEVAGNSTVDREDTFWDQVRGRLGDRGRVLDPQQVRRWLDDPAEARRVVREARAVLAVLDVPDEVPTELADAGGIGPEPAAGGDEPVVDEPGTEPVGSTDGGDGEQILPDEPAPVVERSEPAAAAEEPTPRPTGDWDPSTLPASLRGFDTMFAMADPTAAARKLKGYIHRRHARADSVFRALDRYIEMAPAERSLAVLSQVDEIGPGPRTRRWATRKARALRRKLGIEP